MARGLNSSEWSWHERVHLCAQRPHLLGEDGKLATSFIGRVEYIETDMAYVYTQLDVPVTSVPFENKQQHDGYREYYTTDRQREIVRHVYKEDIDEFGFEF